MKSKNSEDELMLTRCESPVVQKNRQTYFCSGGIVVAVVGKQPL